MRAALLGTLMVIAVSLPGAAGAQAADTSDIHSETASAANASEQDEASGSEPAPAAASRPARDAGVQRVDKAKANYFTEQYNRQVLQTLEAGGGPQSGNRLRWRELYAPR